MRRYRAIVAVIGLLAVAACGGGGGSGGGTPLAVPTAPPGAEAARDDGAIAVSWQPVTGATQYNVYVATATGIKKNNYTTIAGGQKLAGVANPAIITGLVNGTTYYAVVTAVNASGESVESAQASATPVSLSGATDPLYSQQWHLNNMANAGQDVDVAPVWASTCGSVACRGDGVRIAVVDDGLETGHEDLAFNVVPGASHNYITGGDNPTPSDPTLGHGTAVAGVIAARDLNGVGVRGVAPRASLVGYNLIALGGSTQSDETDAMTRNDTVVAVSSNSWGPPDNTGQPLASSQTWKSAVDSGLATGRGGLGTVYVWAAGNGGTPVPTYAPSGIDNSNYDGYANYRGVIAVGAVTDAGVKSSYSERGANLWVSAPGGEFCNATTTAIVTTDLTGNAGENNTSGYNATYSSPDITGVNGNYTKCFNGTSSATPSVSGTVALMLQANPALTARDVRLILAETARVSDPGNNTDGLGWQTGATVASGSGTYHFNHNYGFGVVDAAAAVLKAGSWNNVGPALTPCTVSGSHTNIAIPDSPSVGVPGTAVTDTTAFSTCGINKIERVEVTFTTNHTYAGDLDIRLTSPASKTSILAETHVCTDGTSALTPVACVAYNGWVFSSAVDLGEAANGTWTLTVRDGAPNDTGNITSWSLTVYGRAN